jgi:ornithine cyclodeaminase/alanine dehydrogenase-like protein (mu-crystallin family)
MTSARRDGLVITAGEGGVTSWNGGIRYLDSAAITSALSMPSAIAALGAALQAGPGDLIDRTIVSNDGNDFLVMPAGNDAGFGVKLLTIAPANPQRGLPLIQGIYVLFDGETHAPKFVLDGGALTKLRTAAVSALAASYLARADAEAAVIFGTGVQAAGHAHGMAAVRPLREVVIVNERNPAGADRLVADLIAQGVPAVRGTAAAVATADIVCTCTSSTDPVLFGDALRAGTHVAAIGSYAPTARELDTAAVVRSRVFVEDRLGLRSEIPGDLAIPMAAGAWRLDDLAGDLIGLARAEVAGRSSADEITIMKTVGIAYEDLIVAGAIADALSAST